MVTALYAGKSWQGSIDGKTILNSHPAEGRRLSWPEHTVGSSLFKAAFKVDSVNTHTHPYTQTHTPIHPPTHTPTHTHTPTQFLSDIIMHCSAPTVTTFEDDLKVRRKALRHRVWIGPNEEHRPLLGTLYITLVHSDIHTSSQCTRRHTHTPTDTPTHHTGPLWHTQTANATSSREHDSNSANTASPLLVQQLGTAFRHQFKN